MSPGMRVVLWLVVIPVVIIGTGLGIGAWLVFKRPLTVDAWSTRRALVRAGLERRGVTSPAGRLAVWEGGEGAPLLLLHGAGDQAGTWADIVPSLLGSHQLLIDAHDWATGVYFVHAIADQHQSYTKVLLLK